MILLIDNYDSFTWNLVHLIGGLGVGVEVVRNDQISAQEAVSSGADAIVISPGPGEPGSAGICVETVGLAIEADMPLFGVCLGLQSIAEACGTRVIRAGAQMHGKTSAVTHVGDALFEGIPSPFIAARYHSLVADRRTFSNSLQVIAQSVGDDEIMAIRHRTAPVYGVQFHPESIASQFGSQLMSNFFAIIGGVRKN